MAKRIDREGPIHRSILAYLRRVMPEAMIHHSANESHVSGKASMLASVRKKRDGMVPGFPDLIVLPFTSLTPMFFEVKAEGNYATKQQKAVHAELRTLGYRVAVVRSIEDVQESLTEWNVPTKHVECAINQNMREE